MRREDPMVLSVYIHFNELHIKLHLLHFFSTGSLLNHREVFIKGDLGNVYIKSTVTYCVLH